MKISAKKDAGLIDNCNLEKHPVENILLIGDLNILMKDNNPEIFGRASI